jgi:putative ABC transport system permease protein
VSLATTLLVGLLPALRACRLNVYDTLREGGKSGGSTGRSPLRGALLGAEVAMALVLLTGAGLLIRSFLRLQTVEPGFDTNRLLTLRVWLPLPNDPASGPYFQHEKRITFYRAVLDRFRALPGVESVAAATGIPLTGYVAPVALEPEGLENRPGEATTYAHYGVVSAGYFETMRIPLRGGRAFNSFDTASGEPVAMVSEAAAASLWKGEDPVGKRLRFTAGIPAGSSPAPWMRVVGVVGDVHIKGLEAASPPAFYRCLEQVSSFSTGFVARVAGNPQALAESLRAQVHAVDPEVPVYAVRSMDQVVAAGMAQRRFLMLLVGIFASAAVILAVVGIYAVVSYSISQRTREIGIRIALGAQRADLLRMSIGDAARPVAFGLAGGTLVALGLARFLQSVLFGVGPADAVTYLLVAAGMAAVALLAAYVPARRATRIDPMVALRHE